jgi:tetratricopeptide (TPR) repeat protein
MLLVQPVGLLVFDDSAEESFRKGKVALEKRQYQEAVTQFSEAIRLDSTNPEAFYYRGKARSYIGGQEAKVMADFTEAVRLNPKYADAFRERGWNCRQSIGDARALQDLDKAIELAPKDANAFWMRGYVSYELKQYRKAKDDCQTAIKLNPKEHAIYALLATIQACCPEKEHRDGQDAVKNAKKALDLNSWHWNMDVLAAAYAEDGRFKEAIEWEKKAIEDAKTPKSGGRSLLPSYEKHLGLYEKNKPLRLSSLGKRDGDDSKEQ